MDFDRITTTFTRLLLIAIFCHVYRDWGVAVQIPMLLAFFGYGIYVEWMRVKQMQWRSR